MPIAKNLKLMCTKCSGLLWELNRNLKIGHINVNGRFAKLADMHLLLREVKCDLLGITDTHLTDDIYNNLIKITGYDLARRDRLGSKGGGVVLYFREGLNVYEDLKWNTDQELEAVWLHLTIRSHSTLIGCLYRPPDLLPSSIPYTWPVGQDLD